MTHSFRFICSFAASSHLNICLKDIKDRTQHPQRNCNKSDAIVVDNSLRSDTHNFLDRSSLAFNFTHLICTQQQLHETKKPNLHPVNSTNLPFHTAVLTILLSKYLSCSPTGKKRDIFNSVLCRYGTYIWHDLLMLSLLKGQLPLTNDWGENGRWWMKQRQEVAHNETDHWDMRGYGY